MKTTNHIESLGKIIKEETIRNVEFNILSNTLVLENLEPFPGYLGDNMPGESKPESIFLITSKPISCEKILRLSTVICKTYDLHIDACPVEIKVPNQTLTGIRLKGLETYDCIAELQGHFSKLGIHFARNRKIHDAGIISIEKIFLLEKIDECLYKDLEDELTYYVNIPYHFDWPLFKKVTLHLKNNLENRNFDVAVGFVYFRKLFDFVRVYGKMDIGKLHQIRSKYLEEIRHYKK